MYTLFIFKVTCKFLSYEVESLERTRAKHFLSMLLNTLTSVIIPRM